MLFCLGLFTTSTVAVILDHHGLQRLVVAAIQMRYVFTNTVAAEDVSADGQPVFFCRNASVSAIYRKSLRLSSKARQQFTTGEITNFMSGEFFCLLPSFAYQTLIPVDAQRLVDSVPFSFFVIIGPIELIVCLVLLYRLLGTAVLVDWMENPFPGSCTQATMFPPGRPSCPGLGHSSQPLGKQVSISKWFCFNLTLPFLIAGEGRHC